MFGHLSEVCCMSYCPLLAFPVPSGPPYVTLEASADSVSAGDNFNITCTVLGEPESDVAFSWKFPGQVR